MSASYARSTHVDVNALASGLLRDLALVQTSPQKAFGYKRAAAALLALDRPLTALAYPDGTLTKIAGIGPASTRIILEVLATGMSETVEAAVAQSGRAGDVQNRRALRAYFLSRADVLRVLSDPSVAGPAALGYRGDFQMHSEWSDGVASLTEMADGCIARGYVYAAVTDHSHGLKIAGGMSMAEAAAQRDRCHQCRPRHIVPGDQRD